MSPDSTDAPPVPFIVRDARLDDLPTIVEFNRRLALETEHKILDVDVLTRGVRAALADPDRLRYWVAELSASGVVIGQAAVTREWSDWRNCWLWWFQSVYVNEPHRGQGVFRAIYRHVQASALADLSVKGLRLYVEDENKPAHATYSALGMRPAGYSVYEHTWIHTGRGD